MKVSELRDKIKVQERDELEKLIVEMYKAIPKKIREEKEIDRLIDNPDVFKKKRNATKYVGQNLNFSSIEHEVQVFIKNAYSQYYVAPNRIVPKKERSNWRFTAKRLVEQVTTVSRQPEYQQASATLMEELYKLFCYASGHYVFVSEEPFHTLKITQEDFLKRVVLLKKESGDPDKWIPESLNLVLEHDVDYETLTSSLLYTLLEMLTNAPLKEKMIEEASELLIEKKKSLKKSGKLNQRSIEYEDEEYINNLVEMVFITQSELGEYEQAISFFKKHHVKFDKGVSLFILLDLIMSCQRVEEWINVYEDALKKNIEPRDSLRNAYDYIKRENEFPNYIFVV